MIRVTCLIESERFDVSPDDVQVWTSFAYQGVSWWCPACVVAHRMHTRPEVLVQLIDAGCGVVEI